MPKRRIGGDGRPELNDQERAFIAALMDPDTGGDVGDAYLQSYTDQSDQVSRAVARRRGLDIRRRPIVRAAIAEAYRERQLANQPQVQAVLGKLVEMLEADPLGEAYTIEDGRLVIKDSDEMSPGVRARIHTIRQRERVVRRSEDGKEEEIERTIDIRTTPALDVIAEANKVLGLHRSNAGNVKQGPAVIIMTDKDVHVAGPGGPAAADVPDGPVYTPMSRRRPGVIIDADPT